MCDYFDCTPEEIFKEVSDNQILQILRDEKETTKPNDVKKMKSLLDAYNAKTNVTIYDIIEFHSNFEHIHPFQDGNGRVGRLVALKECLKNNIVSFIMNRCATVYCVIR